VDKYRVNEEHRILLSTALAPFLEEKEEQWVTNIH